MDQIMGKVGSYWMGQQANKEFGSVTKEVDNVSNSIEGGAQWLVNKIKGTVQKPLPELLKDYDLAAGIFPREVTGYDFVPETGLLTVNLPSVCEVSYGDSSLLRFSTTVSGYLEKGKFTNVEGMKTKFIVWVKVTNISSENSKLHFMAGLKKTRNRDAHEVLKDAVAVQKF